MGQQERDAFPFERLGRLEERVDGHDREFDAVRELIGTLREENREGRREHRDEQRLTREQLGAKVDNVVLETSALKEVAQSTRTDLRAFKRVVIGAVSSLFLALIVERLIGGGS